MADETAPPALTDAQVAALAGQLDEWRSVVADITEAAVGPWRERAEKAEAKLATIAANARTLAPEDILRIIGTEGEGHVRRDGV